MGRKLETSGSVQLTSMMVISVSSGGKAKLCTEGLVSPKVSWSGDWGWGEGPLCGDWPMKK